MVRSRSRISWHATQCDAQGTALRRFSGIGSSQCKHTPYISSSMRSSAAWMLLNSFELWSRLRIATSRLNCCCNLSISSAVLSMTMSFLSEVVDNSSLCLASSNLRNSFESNLRTFLLLRLALVVQHVKMRYSSRRFSRANGNTNFLHVGFRYPALQVEWKLFPSW